MYLMPKSVGVTTRLLGITRHSTRSGDIYIKCLFRYDTTARLNATQNIGHLNQYSDLYSNLHLNHLSQLLIDIVVCLMFNFHKFQLEDNQNNSVFKGVLEICNTFKRYDSKFLSATLQGTIIRCIKERQDNFIASFQEDVQYEYLKDRYAAYTSKEEVTSYLKKTLKCRGTNHLTLPHLHRNCQGDMLLVYYKLISTEDNESNIRITKFLIAYGLPRKNLEVLNMIFFSFSF